MPRRAPLRRDSPGRAEARLPGSRRGWGAGPQLQRGPGGSTGIHSGGPWQSTGVRRAVVGRDASDNALPPDLLPALPHRWMRAGTAYKHVLCPRPSYWPCDCISPIFPTNTTLTRRFEDWQALSVFHPRLPVASRSRPIYSLQLNFHPRTIFCL